MTTITIFGNGTMGQAIAGVLARGGADIQHIGSDETSTQISGDIVVLAVPYRALAVIADAGSASPIRGERQYSRNGVSRSIRPWSTSRSAM